MLARARELEALGRDIIHLEVGEPDFDTPEHVKRAGDRSARSQPDALHAFGRHRAAARYGRRLRLALPRHRALRARPSRRRAGAQADHLERAQRAARSRRRVRLCGSGVSGVRLGGSYLQAKAIPVPLLERTNFRLDLDELEAKISPRTKVLLLNSPHNPTGGVLTRADLERIAELAIRNDVTVISDEIYNRNLYDAEFFSIAALDGMRERTILLDGFSKAYAMTGWRLGYAIMPAYVARVVSLMGQNTYSCTATFVQLAGAAALTRAGRTGAGDGCRIPPSARRDRRATLTRMPGVTCKTPEGAFYVFPNVSQITHDDARWLVLLEDAGVAALGGSAFGEAGRGYMRFSYAASLETIHARSNAFATHFRTSRRRSSTEFRSSSRPSRDARRPQRARAALRRVSRVLSVRPDTAGALTFCASARNERVGRLPRTRPGDVAVGLRTVLSAVLVARPHPNWLLGDIYVGPGARRAASAPRCSRPAKTRPRGGRATRSRSKRRSETAPRNASTKRPAGSASTPGTSTSERCANLT